MLRRRGVVLLVAALCVVTLGWAARQKRQEARGRLRFQGQSRWYLVHLPPTYTGKRAVPLVLLLHGATANPYWVEQESGFCEKADREGFIVVSPAGSPARNGRRDSYVWNSGGLNRFFGSADEVGFLRAVVKQVQQDYRIDPKRIYATGMSNGGMMAQRLGVEAADVFAAIGPVAGTLNVPCRAGTPMPVVMVHGLKDGMVPYDGRRGGRFDMASVPDSVRAWVKRDGCKPTPKRAEQGNVIIERYAGGRDGSEVVLYTTKEGEHAWPHARGRRGARDLEATDVIWAFFKQHPKE